MKEFWLIKEYHDDVAGYDSNGDEIMYYAQKEVGIVEASKEEVLTFLKKWDNASHIMKGKRIQVIENLEHFIPYIEEVEPSADEIRYLEE